MPTPKPLNISEAVANDKAVEYYDESDPFSNPFPCNLVYEGVPYLSAEHAYQSQRFIHPRLIYQVMSAPNVLEIKKIVAAHREHIRPDWSQVKFRIMIEINYAKFSQNPDLRDLLIDTGDQLLIEHSPEDNCWGMVTEENNLAYGSNFAGRVLQFVRRRLINESLREQET